MKLPKGIAKKAKKVKIHSSPLQVKKEMNKDYKIERFGPFVFETAGSNVRFSNLLGPNEQKEFKKELISMRPKLEEEIIKLNEKLKIIIDGYCSIDFLDYMTIETTFTNPETLQLFDKDLTEMHYEYALSYITANSVGLNENHPSLEICIQFRDTVKEIIKFCIQYYMWEEFGDQTEKSIRFQSIIKFLNLRGDSYENHHIDLCQIIFSPHDRFFQANFGFTISQLIDMINDIRKQRVDTFYKKGELLVFRKEIEKIVEDFLKEKNIESINKIPSNLISELYYNEKIEGLRNKSRQILFETSNYYSEISLNLKSTVELLDFFSMQLGDNDDFLRITPNWPLNNSKIYRKPFLKIDNTYYGFGNLIFFRNIIRILEQLITDNDRDYFENRYMKKKSKILEDLTIEYLTKLLPKAKVYQNLFYRVIVKGKPERVEVDGIVLYDQHLFIIEAKANSFTLSARRGSIKRIKSTLAKILDKAYVQAVRCKKYIQENKIANFEYENGQAALSINKDDFDYFYLINTTIERLSHLSIQLNSVKQLKLLEGTDQLWTIFINDLRVISEINDSPSIFLLYLQRRYMANENINLFNQDELDIYSFFLKTGLFFPKKTSDKEHIHFLGYTDKIDKYFMYKSNNLEEVEKPSYNISENYFEIVKKIEEIEKPGFSIASTYLLYVDSSDQKLILKFITKLAKSSYKTGDDYRFFLNYKDLSCGFLFVIRTDIQNNNWDDFYKFLELMMYKYHLEIGIFYQIKFDENRNLGIDFELIKQKWKFDERKSRELRKLNLKGMKTIKR